MQLRRIVSNNRSESGRARGLSRRAPGKNRCATAGPRRLLVESLETRALLTYAYPYGATPDDTGEYMLGKIAVNVVLMESDSSLAPHDNGTLHQIVPGSGGSVSTVTYTPENWTADEITAAKKNVTDAMQWWVDTFKKAFPNAPANSLVFDINFTHADEPVHTGYEPIARLSDDILGDSTTTALGTVTVSGVVDSTQFSGGSGLSSVDGAYDGKELQFTSGPLAGQRGRVVDYVGATHTFTFAANTFTTAPGVNDRFQLDQGWLYDFLDSVGYGKTGIFATDMRSFNDAMRQADNADWAFTIFVVDNSADYNNGAGDGEFGAGGSYPRAYSFPGGQFMVVPANRPVTTFAHETGHQFWALDEYSGPSNANEYRGYYNTQNYNDEDNPDFVGVNEIQSIAPYQGSVTGGTFTLTFNLASGLTFTTGPIAYNASTGTIQSAISAAALGKVPNWVNGDIAVVGTTLADTGVALGFLGNSVHWANHSPIVVNGANLTGGGTPGGVTEIRAGVPAKAQQLPTIMGTDHLNRNPQTFIQSISFNTHVLDKYTMAMIGWQDTDLDGIMDVLDVPFTLTGTGSYDAVGGVYSFHGATHVNTLPNQNPAGTQDDVTINQIGEVQYQVNNGPWIQAVPPYPLRTYSASVDFDVKIPAGSTIRVRSISNQNGLTSNVFTGSTDTPTNDILAGLEGAIYLDQNGNARWDSGEPLKAGVGLTLTDQNNQPLAISHAIEPDDYAADWVLNSVDSTATLSAVGLNKGTGDVAARTYFGVPSAGKVFTATDYPNDSLPTWDDQRQMRVDFSSPVSAVRIRAYGDSTTPSYARLDAYNSSGQVIARYTSGQVTNSTFETMVVSRAAGDIKYVIAYGWTHTEVVLDSLSWGPPISITSDSQGAFSLSYLPDGTYNVHVTAGTGYHATNPSSGTATIVVSGGITSSNMNFGVTSDVTPTYKFHNYDSRYNVNPKDDNQITALDALLIINFINAHPGTDGTIPLSLDPNTIGYIDVVADGICAANDALAIINYINAHPEREAEAEQPAAATISSADLAQLTTIGSSQAEGESTSGQTPQNAAAYYAQQPVHFLNIRGADKPCNCAACLATRSETVEEMDQKGIAEAVTELDVALSLIAQDVSRAKWAGLV